MAWCSKRKATRNLEKWFLYVGPRSYTYMAALHGEVTAPMRGGCRLRLHAATTDRASSRKFESQPETVFKQCNNFFH